MNAAEVPAARVFPMADIFRDAHYKARDLIAEVAEQDLGTVKLANVVPKLSESPGRIRWSGRHVGQDTKAVLTELANFTSEAVDALAAAGVVHCESAPEVAARNARH